LSVKERDLEEVFSLLHVHSVAIKATFYNESILGLSLCKCMCSHELAKQSSSGERPKLWVC